MVLLIVFLLGYILGSKLEERYWKRRMRQAMNCSMLVQLIDAAYGGYASEAFDILTDDEREDIYNGRKKDEAQQETADAK